MAYIALLVAAALVGIDQLTKLWIIKNVEAGNPIELIHIGSTKLINITYVENTGAAFSILSDKRIFLIIATAIFICAGIIFLFKNKNRHPLLYSSLALIIGGGIGNLIDRIFRQYVVDFIDLKFINFAVFNFADICVVIGAILLAVFVIFFDDTKPKIKTRME